MATVFTLPSPHAVSNMTLTRVPLQEASSAVLNSPLRPAQTVYLGNKRPRLNDEPNKRFEPRHERTERNNENLCLKRKFVETNESSLRLNGLPPRQSSQQTALQKKLEAVRIPSTATSVQPRTRPEQNIDTYKQWHKHHRRAFPAFVFYFDSVPEETKQKYVQQIRQLGAREEQFFSKAVTHVITSRPMPAVTDAPISNTMVLRSPARQSTTTQSTINPSLLDHEYSQHKFTFEPPLTKKYSAGDVVSRAKDMAMKVWTVEKFARILHALVRPESDNQLQDVGQTQIRQKLSREAELSRLLKEDKRNTTVEKSWMTDMVPFRGFYLYVRDLDERSKPIMVRDYPKPLCKEQGKWPQLRPTVPSRCPFLEDIPSKPRTRRVTEPVREASIGEHKLPARAQTLDERIIEAHRQDGQLGSHVKILKECKNPPEMKPPDRKSASTESIPLYGSAQASMRARTRLIQGEPVASGLQPCNVTSAIRSQMISSAVGNPGGKAGSSRELNALRRKVVEKSGIPEAGMMKSLRANISRHASIPAAGGKPVDAAPLIRGTKRKTLDDPVHDKDAQHTRTQLVRKRRAVEKEPKAGYCENCRNKFDNFDEHVFSREHRKFALDIDNFHELDTLLAKLQRT